MLVKKQTGPSENEKKEKEKKKASKQAPTRRNWNNNFCLQENIR